MLLFNIEKVLIWIDQLQFKKIKAELKLNNQLWNFYHKNHNGSFNNYAASPALNNTTLKEIQKVSIKKMDNLICHWQNVQDHSAILNYKAQPIKERENRGKRYYTIKERSEREVVKTWFHSTSTYPTNSKKN